MVFNLNMHAKHSMECFCLYQEMHQKVEVYAGFETSIDVEELTRESLSGVLHQRHLPKIHSCLLMFFMCESVTHINLMILLLRANSE